MCIHVLTTYVCMACRTHAKKINNIKIFVIIITDYQWGWSTGTLKNIKKGKWISFIFVSYSSIKVCVWGEMYPPIILGLPALHLDLAAGSRTRWNCQISYNLDKSRMKKINFIHPQSQQTFMFQNPEPYINLTLNKIPTIHTLMHLSLTCTHTHTHTHTHNDSLCVLRL